jgi:hypothetical protein
MSSRLDVPPLVVPPPPVPEGGGDSEWTQLTRARNDIDAHLLVGRLQEGGVETRTVKDRHAPGAWIYAGSNPWAPVAVFVRRFQLDEARLILMEISLEETDRQRALATDRPPPRGIRASPLLWWATALVLGAIFTALAIAQMGGVR